MIAGKLEVTIKINELPQAKTVENNWQQFEIDCDGRIITVTVKPKVWKKLTDAATNYPQWVAAITGKIGQSTKDGFILGEPTQHTSFRAQTQGGDNHYIPGGLRKNNH
jgi:hypothetical protein